MRNQYVSQLTWSLSSFRSRATCGISAGRVHRAEKSSRPTAASTANVASARSGRRATPPPAPPASFRSDTALNPGVLPTRRPESDANPCRGGRPGRATGAGPPRDPPRPVLRRLRLLDPHDQAERLKEPLEAL